MSDRDCKHGFRARGCVRCEAEADIAELEAENAALLAERDEWRQKAGVLLTQAAGLLAERDRYERAVNAAMRELGVPTKRYPAPAANAWRILAAALSAPEEGESE